MIVQAFDRVDQTARFDPESGRLEVLPAGGPGDGAGSPQGHFGFLGGTSVVLYRSGDALRLRVGDKDVVADEGIAVTHTRSGGSCALTVLDRATERPLATISYAAPDDSVGEEFDPTPFVDAEDFDLGLFLANVTGDPDRRKAIYAGRRT